VLEAYEEGANKGNMKRGEIPEQEQMQFKTLKDEGLLFQEQLYCYHTKLNYK
jgi:hypothetical protein